MLAHQVEPPSFIWSSIQTQLPEPKRRRYGNLTYLLPVAACVMGMVFFILPTEKRIIDTGISQNNNEQSFGQSLPQQSSSVPNASIQQVTAGINTAPHEEAGITENTGASVNGNILDGSRSIYANPFKNKVNKGNTPIFNIFPSPDVNANTVKSYNDISMLPFEARNYTVLDGANLFDKSRLNHHLETKGYRSATHATLSNAQLAFKNRFQIGGTFAYSNNGSNNTINGLGNDPTYAPRDPNTGMLMPTDKYLKVRTGNNTTLSAGLEVHYNLGKHFSLSSGLRYTQNVINRTTAILGPDPLDGASANPADIAFLKSELKQAGLRGWSQLQIDAVTQQLNALTAGQAVYSSPTRTTLKTIEIPAQLRYTVDLKNFSIYVQGGATGRYIGSANNLVTTPEGTIQSSKASGLKKIQLFGSAQGGCAVKITKSIGFEGGPFIGRNITNTGNTAVDNLKLFNIGATAGIFYHL